MRWMILAVCIGACSAKSNGGNDVGTSGGSTSGSGSAGNTSGSSASGTSTGGASCSEVIGTPSGDTCASFMQSLGKDHFMVGFSGADATAAAAPFDIRYQYLSAGLPDSGAPCTSCLSCSVGGQSCANSEKGQTGCAWWGCYQYDHDPPGEYVSGFVTAANAKNEIPMFTYYEILQEGYTQHTLGNSTYASFSEGADEVKIAANDPKLMSGYFNDFRFMLQQIGNGTALIHHEPDFWGYAEQVNLDPTKIPAAVASANPTDCCAQPNTIAGMGACLIAMTRIYAPHAKIALHASGWASNMDVLGNSDSGLDVAGEAAKTVGFLSAAGESGADFVVSDISDRDAAYYQIIKDEDTWWDATNATLPSFHQGWAFSSAISSGLGKPLLWWQVPLGNMSLSNANDCSDSNPNPGMFQDNRVDYILSNVSELTASGAVGVAFGSGLGCCTAPESDGGNLIAKTNAYSTAKVTDICP